MEERGHQPKFFRFGEDSIEETVTIYIPEVMDGDYGLYVWPCAPVLAQYVWQNRMQVKGKNVLELGAGTGLAGLIASKVGGHVTLSDACHLLHCQERCQASICLNGLQGQVKVIGITWGQFSPQLLDMDGIDIILGSDCFYDSKDFESILVTVSYLLDRNTSAEFWTTYQERSSDRSIEPLLQKWHLSCKNVPLADFGANSANLGGSDLPGNHVIHMLVIKRDNG